MIRIGIDPSLQSTGVCVYDDETNINTYYIISSKMTGKMKAFKSDYIIYRPYTKIPTTDLGYSEKESVKTQNVKAIVDNLNIILSDVRVKSRNLPEVPGCTMVACVEGISYGSAGAGQVADLAGLNYLIREALYIKGIPFIIVPPTQLKKSAVGNGAAGKDMMISSWKMLDRNISGIPEVKNGVLKVDDCADAFFLAHYNEP